MGISTSMTTRLIGTFAANDSATTVKNSSPLPQPRTCWLMPPCIRASLMISRRSAVSSAMRTRSKSELLACSRALAMSGGGSIKGSGASGAGPAGFPAGTSSPSVSSTNSVGTPSGRSMGAGGDGDALAFFLSASRASAAVRAALAAAALSAVALSAALVATSWAAETFFTGTRPSTSLVGAGAGFGGGASPGISRSNSSLSTRLQVAHSHWCKEPEVRSSVGWFIPHEGQ